MMSIRKALRTNGKRPRRAPARPPRLVVETLEDRCLLSAGYVQTNLVSDQAGQALFLDKKLVNPWGIAVNQLTGAIRVAENGTGLSELFNEDGKRLPHWKAAIPAPGGGSGTPTGLVFNTTHDFVVSSNGRGPANFLASTEDGTIVAWRNHVTTDGAIIVVDNSGAGAVYKGLAIGSTGDANFIYAADFTNATVDVFNKNFQQVTLAGNFTDPNLPEGYAPFNIANIGGQLYVTYAVQNGHDELDGPGLGLIDVFDTNGNFVQRLVDPGGVLNAPWGMAVAPKGFGPLSNALLVGNFGDGTINAFDPSTGSFIGTMTDQSGSPIAIEGLWGITFGAGEFNDTHTLFFAAGVGDEAHGLLGQLKFKKSGGAGADLAAALAASHGNTAVGPVAQQTAHLTDAAVQAMFGDVASSTSKPVSGSDARPVATLAHAVPLDSAFAALNGAVWADWTV